MSMGDDKLKYLINNGYKEIKPTLLGFQYDGSIFRFIYTIKQSLNFYKLIIDCEIFYNDVIKNLSIEYDKLPEDYNASHNIILIYFFIPLPKENKNNFTIYLKNVEIFKNQGFNHCHLDINEGFVFNSKFKNFRIETIEKIINYTSCLPYNQYTLSLRGTLTDSANVDDNLHSEFSNDYIDAEIIKKMDEKIKNSKITNNNVALFYYLLNYYYSHEKK